MVIFDVLLIPRLVRMLPMSPLGPLLAVVFSKTAMLDLHHHQNDYHKFQ